MQRPLSMLDSISHPTTPLPAHEQVAWFASAASLRLLPLLLLLPLSVLGACASGSAPPSLARALKRYQTALQSNDQTGAYAMLSSEQQATISSTRFTDQWVASEPERSSQQTQLRTFLPAGLAAVAPELVLRSMHVRIREASAPAVELALSSRAGQRWQVARPSLVAADIQTPVAALRGLVRALEQLSTTGVLQVLSTQTRQAVEQELRERIERMRVALQKLEAIQTAARLASSTHDSPQPPASVSIEFHGNRARIQYDPRFFVEFVREAEGWRVRDLN